MSGIPAGAGSLLGKRLGKYEILALLALGGTAEIYLARIGGAAGFEKYVVVKCLHDHLADDTEFVKMFLDEARLAAHLDHSNIVQTMELGEHENRYYMVMEFLAGLSLAMMVRRAGERLQGGKIPIPLAINILAQACAGLHYAHEKSANGKPLNIVHRDISPQNLVISFEGVVKVVDFGIAKAELRETQTRSGTIKGKFAYMSPEQCVANNVDRRTDVFALGVIGHELLTGRRLFKKNSPYETYQAVIECNVPPPSTLNVEVDPALDPLIMKALAKNKEDRYQTAEAFGDALLGYLHHRGKGSGPGEVSRFFDQHFGQEIEEHGARMRELISGREIADGMNWGSEEEEAAKKANETVDLGAPSKPSESSIGSIPLDTMDLVEPSNVDGDAGDDEDEPAERTRIEANPLEALEELNQAAARPSAPVIPSVVSPGAPARKTPLPAALVPTQIAPATPPRGQPVVLPPSGALPLPPAPTPPAKTSGPSLSGPPAGSGKFPELANLPTMIAEPDEEPAEPELARTQLGALPLDATAAADGPAAGAAGAKTPPPQVRAGSGRFTPTPGVDPHARTSMDMQAPVVNPSAQRPVAGPPSGQGPIAGPPGRPSGQAPLASYPVMNAELREQIDLGATVFPSDGPAPRPSVPPSTPPRPPVGDSGPRPAPDSGPRDLLADLPGRAPTEMGAHSLLDTSEPLFPRAADLASPVGKQYGAQVDWAAAAAMSAKAVPPWKLALIFVGAIGGALLLTMLVVMILR